jgi:AcrR family transcriptional regulator
MARAGRAAVGGDAGAADGERPRSASSHRADPRPARTRAALIAAGQRLLAEGRSDASIQHITETAGVGFGSFFNHFSGKPDLWAAAVSATLRVHGDIVRVDRRRHPGPTRVGFSRPCDAAGTAGRR